jgi:hypothetical protein
MLKDESESKKLGNMSRKSSAAFMILGIKFSSSLFVFVIRDCRMGPVERNSVAALLPAVCHSFCNGQRGRDFFKSNSFSILVVGERSLLSFASLERESCNGETRDDSEVDEQERGEGSTHDELEAGEGEGLMLSSPLFLEELGIC